MNVVCVNWGTKYPKKYVHILEAMVKRNLTAPHKFICFTDDPTGYTCETRPLPSGLNGWWNKVYLFKEGLFTEKTLFLDLDIVITGSLDELVKYEGFIAIKDWNYDSYNSSVMILGKHPELWDDFKPEVAENLYGDQDWITQRLKFRNYFPENWIKSFKTNCLAGVPKDCKIVVFHGEPKPHTAKRRWVNDLWQI